MESNSKPGRIQVSRSTYERVHDLGFEFEERSIEVKGKGVMRAYLIHEKHHTSATLTNTDIEIVTGDTQYFASPLSGSESPLPPASSSNPPSIKSSPNNSESKREAIDPMAYDRLATFTIGQKD